jgi:serine phosphatase RsbU (regulator of sigma subunit)
MIFSFFHRLTVIIILLCITYKGYSQINKRGTPFIKNYTSKEYNASEQNWAVVQDHRGLIYVGNQESGVLEYDGNEWRSISLPNNPGVRSLAIDEAGTIFVGAVGDIGYLTPNKNGFLSYISLKNKMDTSIIFDDVWRTYSSKDRVYFATKSKVFIYNYNEIEIIDLPQNSFFSFLIDDKLYVGNPVFGLQVLNNETNEVRDAIGGDFYKGKNLIYIGSYDESRYIMCTYENGSFLYDKKFGLTSYQPTPSNKYSLLIKNGVYAGTATNNNSYALATLYKGVSIFNKEGKLNYQISENTGLQFNTVTFVYYNENKIDAPLWVSLNNGISKIEISSPINFFSDIKGINDITSLNKKLYISTDEGLYSLDFENKLPVFKKDELISSQSWSFCNPKSELKNDFLLLATSEGVYKISENQQQKISEDYHCRIIYQSTSDLHKYYVGTTEGLLRYEIKNDRWVENGFIEGIDYQIHSIAEDDKGNLWLGTYLNGLIKYNEEKNQIDFFGLERGLPSLKSNRINIVNDQLLFTTENGIFFFDENEKRFKNYEKLDKSFSDGTKGILGLFPDRDGRIWSISFKNNEYWVEVLTKTFSNNYSLVSKPFKRLPRMTFQSIYTDEENITWIGGPEGLYSFDNNIKRDYNQEYKTLIRKVSIGQDSVIYGGTSFKMNSDSSLSIILEQNVDHKPLLNYGFNSVEFEFVAPFFENEAEIEYSWILDGLEKHWNHWAKENKVSYNNLFEGTYTFKVKANNVYDTESLVTEYQFKVLPPWYRTKIAYIFYFIIFVFFIRLIIKLNVRRLEKEKIRLEGIVKERTAEVVRQKEKIEKAYENVKMLSKIGQDVTANLSVDTILNVVYKNVNTLMDAAIFAIAIYNEDRKVLDFLGKESIDGEILRNSDPLDNEKLLSVWCFVNQQEIFINNYSQNNHPFEQYDSKPDFQKRESLIYLPLTSKEKKIGIISVQSVKPNAYSDYHLNILKNLAVYTSIALDNAEAYEKIEAQKEEIIAQRDEIEAQRDYVTQQRDQIAKQKQNITDSIQYAKRIQSAVLPPADQISESLSDHFILFKPRDIVSGDFYWMRQIDHYVVITAADCTGHGVPGAFMSMLGVSFLNEIVRRKDITKASDVLNELRKYVKTSLRQTGKDGEAKDGMDMSLCVVDLKNYHLQYAGAYNPLYLFRDKELIERKADKMPIGIHINEKETFTNHELELKKSDVIYLFSDGFPDQFGGVNGGKFKTKQFKKLLMEIHQKPMDEQKNILDNTLIEWQGNHEQVDDITVIGIKIN